MKLSCRISCVTLVFVAFSFAQVARAETAAKTFDENFQACVSEMRRTNALLSARYLEGLRGPSFMALEALGVDGLPFVYREALALRKVSGSDGAQVTCGVELSVKRRILGYLWASITHMYVGDCPLDESGEMKAELLIIEWMEDSRYQVERRMRDLLSEMRKAAAQGRRVDAKSRAIAIARCGLFCLPGVFRELQDGREDVVEVLRNFIWDSSVNPGVGRLWKPKDFRRDTLLDWWARNKTSCLIRSSAEGKNLDGEVSQCPSSP